MNFQNPIHVVAQPATGIGIRQNLRRRKGYNLTGGSVFWFSVSKIVFCFLVVVFGLNTWIGSNASDTGKLIQALEAQRHGLKDAQMALLAERAQLTSARHIQQLAETELALYVPEEGQVHKLR